jgi:glucokinase
MGRAWLGIDLGGTNTQVGLVAESGLLARERFATQAGQGTGQWLESLAKAVHNLRGKGPAPAAAGVASPGVIQRPEGVVLSSPNLPAWNGFALAQKTGEALGLKAVVENDANCYTLGEHHFGAGQGRDLACFTLGTGVGGGLIIDGCLVIGPLGSGGELGHTLAVNGGRICGCGAKGCVESYASATGLRGMLQEALDQGAKTSLGRDAEVTDLAQAARAGDALAQEIFERAGRVLGTAFANVVAFTGLDLIIIGGGVAHAWPLMAAAADAALGERLQIVDSRRVDIRLAQLGDDAPLLGAAAMARDLL